MATTHSDVVLAAVAAAGPDNGDGNWMSIVEQKARDIAVMLDEHSPVSKAVEQIVNPDKVFTGVIVNVEREESSNRAKILINSGTKKTIDGVPEGHEIVRTDRLERAAARNVGNACGRLVGRYVRFYVEMEPFANDPDRKVRIVRHVVDLGPAREGASG